MKLFEMYFQSRRLFLGMDVIGSLMTRDVFVAATSESTESVTFVEVHANCLLVNCKFALRRSESVSDLGGPRD